MKVVFGLILGALVFATLGCGPASGVPVSGAISFKGQPVSNANVVFTPLAGGAIGTAETNEAGEFSAVRMVNGATGLQPGEYLVSLTPKSTVDTSSETAEYDYSPSPPPPFPPRYVDSSLTDLKVTVDKGGTNRFDLELKE